MKGLTKKQQQVYEALKGAMGQYLTPQEVGKACGQDARTASGFAQSKLAALEAKGYARRGQSENGGVAWAAITEG